MKWVVCACEGLGRGDIEAALLFMESMLELRAYVSGSKSSTKIWLAGRIFRGIRLALPERL